MADSINKSGRFHDVFGPKKHIYEVNMVKEWGGIQHQNVFERIKAACS